ncbi:MAG: N-formylmaleamate deformylase [Glaciecola sp.]|jgi:N-formylmaleamate deformylase
MITRKRIFKKVRTLTLMLSVFTALLLTPMHTVAQNAFKVEVKGEGPSIIFIPGLMSDASVFESLADDLSKRNKVHLMSVKGFGSTPATRHFSLEKLLNDIVHYIDSNKLQNPNIIGHSMGGLTGFMLASYHEDKIGKLVSIDGLPFIGPILTRTNATTADMMRPQAQNIKAMFTNMTKQQLRSQTQQGIYVQATSLANQTRVVEMASQSDPSTVGRAMYDVLTIDMREPLKKSSTTILMLGASGGFTELAQHEQVRALYEQQFENVKNAEVVMNTKTRHFMFFDDAQWVSQQVTQFLDK